MATATQLEPALMTMEEYLRTSFRPDCDFVDGRVEERNVGDKKHSFLQAWLAFWFLSHMDEWNVRAATEYRTRVSSSRVRLPDVSVVYDDAAVDEDIRATPPLIAIEILSPEDRMARVLVRLEDFRKMGILNIWLFNPEERTAFVYEDGGLRPVRERLSVSNTPIYLELAAAFKYVDGRSVQRPK